MTQDEMIERCITAAIPELRVAFKGLLAGESYHIFNIVEGKNSQTGVTSTLVCFIAAEPLAAVLEGTAKGIERMQEIFISQAEALKRGKR